MAEEIAGALPADGGGEQRRKREPLLSAVCSSMQYVFHAARTEGFKRQSDLYAAALLPVSSLLLVLAISMTAPTVVKMMAFLVPVLALLYYMALRIGIVKTMNQRQAYLTWHMLLGTFLLGGAFALFACYFCTFLISWATGGS